MTITIATKQLIETLSDALQTAADRSGGIHLATHRGPWGEEPGDVDVLAATSTTSIVLGHTWIPVNGQARQPSVWPVESTKTVLAICKSLASTRGKEHTVDVDMVMADPAEDAKEGDHPGWTMTLSETPALFESDTEFQFHAHHEGRFPVGMARRALRGKLTADDVVEAPLTQWNAHVLGPLVAVAKRRGCPIQMFKSPDAWMQIVQIGDTWLGAAFPIRPLPGAPTDEPSVDPILGDVDDVLRDTLEDMKAKGITVTVDNPRGAVGKTLADAVGYVSGPVELNEQFRDNCAKAVADAEAGAE